MKKCTVSIPGHEYDILIQPGLLSQCGKAVREILPPESRIFIITDEIVAPLYLKTVENSLSAAGFTVHSLCIPAGESSKSLAMLEYLYLELTTRSITRSDAILALGGGVVGDLAGFAAATILRGVPFIQAPTTLLAQVDSSVGGKVAVNLPNGKNLVGAFYQPRLVLMDPMTLSTLPEQEFSSGMAEVIKYGCIQDEPFFRKLETIGKTEGRSGIMQDIVSILYTCCDIKARITAADERDTGERRILNFGHTLGHALETAYHYESYTHGQAVAAGMCLISRIGVQTGVTPPEVPARIRSMVRSFHLPESIPCSPAEYERAIALDKKSQGDTITLVLLSGIGRAILYPMPQKQLFSLLQNLNESR